MIACD